MTTYAKFEEKSAPLSSDFGRDFLFRKYDAELAQYILDCFGTYSRGPRKGLQKGYINWRKCTSGGWVKDGPAYMGDTPVGHVERPGTSRVRVSLGRGDEGLGSLYADTVAQSECETREGWCKRCWNGVDEILFASKARRWA